MFSRPVPHFHNIIIGVPDKFCGSCEMELFQDMLHDGPGLYDINIVSPDKPLSYKVLGIAFVFVPGYDEVEVEFVVVAELQPAGEERFKKVQFVSFRSTRFDPLYYHAVTICITTTVRILIYELVAWAV
jgi:hypothetical protein